MAIGFVLYKKKMVTAQGSKELGSLLLYVILPVVIIKSYLVDFSWELLRGLGLSFLVALVTLIIAILLSRAAFGKRYPVEHFSSAFSNAGFIGIPLVKMVFDDSIAVFYVASFVALLNILQWTYGLVVMTGSKEHIRMKKIATNPIVISFVAGVIIFLLPVQVPGILMTAVDGIAALNAPVAMLIMGIYVAQMSLLDLFCDPKVYLCSLFRLIVIPAATILVLSLIPGNVLLKEALLIVAATPVGSNVVIFAQMFDRDAKQATKDVCLSTILSIVTIPIVVGVAGGLWS